MFVNLCVVYFVLWMLNTMSIKYSNYKMYNVPGDNLQPDTGHWLVITLDCSKFLLWKTFGTMNKYKSHYHMIAPNCNLDELKKTYFITQKHDNWVRYTLCSLEHFLLYINNIHIHLSISTHKLQSIFIYSKNMKCTKNKTKNHYL